MKKITKKNNEEELFIKLIKVQEEYIFLLVEEIEELADIASIHGWESGRVEKGEFYRKKIKILNEMLYNIENIT